MSVAGLCDHTCRIWRRTESKGARRETVGTYAIPDGYSELDCAFTRRRSVLADSGAGLQPVGQRTVYLPYPDLTWKDRDIVEIYAGPSIYDMAMRLEVVSIAIPRGNHVELIVQEWAGRLPEAPTPPGAGAFSVGFSSGFDI